MQFLPAEVQGYLRHVLHVIGMLIVARGGFSGDDLEIYVGAAVNLIALVWYVFYNYQKYKKNKGEAV